MLALLRYAVLNTWTYCIKDEFLPWKDWRKNLIAEMLEQKL